MNDHLTTTAAPPPETAKQRAKRLFDELARASSLLNEALEIVGSVAEEKQEIFDERSERWQESEKGQEAQEELNVFEQIVAQMEEARDYLDPLVM